jgi:hypothetical protein
VFVCHRFLVGVSHVAHFLFIFAPQEAENVILKTTLKHKVTSCIFLEITIAIVVPRRSVYLLLLKQSGVMKQ